MSKIPPPLVSTSEPARPAVLSYATAGKTARLWWRWIVAIGCGAVIGVAAGDFAFEPMLRAIVGNAQLYFGLVVQPFSLWMHFIEIAGMSGAIVGCCSVAVVRHRKMWFGWPIIFSLVFLFGLSLGLLYMNAEWVATANTLSKFMSRIITPRGIPYIPSGLPTVANFQHAGVPVLTPLICGCVADVFVLVMMLGFRSLGLWPSRFARQSPV